MARETLNTVSTWKKRIRATNSSTFANDQEGREGGGEIKSHTNKIAAK